jgi:hypothetical protein
MNDWIAPEFLLDALIEDVFNHDFKRNSYIHVYKSTDHAFTVFHPIKFMRDGSKFKEPFCTIKISTNRENESIIYCVTIHGRRAFEISRSSLVGSVPPADWNTAISGDYLHKWSQVTQLSKKPEAFERLDEVLFKLEDLYAISIMDKIDL